MTTKTDTIDRNSPFALFETDKELERTGLRLDYGKFYFTVARAGGSNDRFREVLRQKMEPHRRAMATETMDDKLADKLAIEAFAEAVVLGWGRVDADGVEHPGEMTWRDGSIRQFSTGAVIELFTMLEDLARDVMGQAQRVALFRRSIAEIDAKN